MLWKEKELHMKKNLRMDKPMTLEEYKAKAEKDKEEELAFRTRLTNIKCEKCNGVYRYKNSFEKLLTNPPQKIIICDACKDQQHIPC